MDWSGSSAQRRLPSDAGLFHTRKKLPTFREYRVPKGTPCKVQKFGQPWRDFHTRKNNLFTSIHRETDDSLQFFWNGWIMSVKRKYVRTKQIARC